MIELAILTGPDRGKSVVLRNLPARVGRGPGVEAVLSGPGVWDHHATLSLDSDGHVRIRAEGDARVAVEDVSTADAPLKSGCRIDLGGVGLRFGMHPVAQRALGGREALVWVAGVVLLAVQGYLIWWTGR